MWHLRRLIIFLYFSDRCFRRGFYFNYCSSIAPRYLIYLVRFILRIVNLKVYSFRKEYSLRFIRWKYKSNLFRPVINSKRISVVMLMIFFQIFVKVMKSSVNILALTNITCRFMYYNNINYRWGRTDCRTLWSAVLLIFYSW